MLHAPDITQPVKDEFIRLIYDGHRPEDAARELDSTATQFKRLRNPNSSSYDPDFAERFDAAINSDQHKNAFLEGLRAEVWKRAKDGSDRLLEKLSYIYDPDWEPLRAQNLNVNMNVQAIHQLLPHMSLEELEAARERARAKLDKPEIRLLPPAETV